MCKLHFKWALKSFFKSPLRVLISLLLTIISLVLVCFSVSVSLFDWIKYDKELYYHPYGYTKNEKYMGFQWEYGYRTRLHKEPSKEDIKEMQRGNFPKEEVEKLMQTLEKRTSLGYALCHNQKVSVTTGIPYKGDILELQGKLVNIDGNKFGPYMLSEYIGLAPNNPIRVEKIPDRIFDDEGNFAPYVDYNYLGQIHFSYGTYFRDVVCYQNMDEKSLEAYGYKLHGRLPENINEVVIPSCLYQSFVSYGYQNASIRPYQKEEINSYDDIIGKELRLSAPKKQYYTLYGEKHIEYDPSNSDSFPVKIVGVMEYDYEAEQFEQYLFYQIQSIEEIPQRDFEEGFYGQLYCSEKAFAPIFATIVHEDYFKEYAIEKEYVTDFCVLKRCAESDEYFKIGTEWFVNHPFSLALENTYTGHITYFNYSTAFIRPAAMSLMAIVHGFRMVIYLLLILSCILNTLLLSEPFLKRDKSIKILRSIGVSRKKLFFAVSMVLALFLIVCLFISFVLAQTAMTLLTNLAIDWETVEFFTGITYFPKMLTIVPISALATILTAFVSMFITIVAMYFIQKKGSDLERLTAKEKEKKKK